MIVHTRYSVGDQVYHAQCIWGTKRVRCEDCDGNGDFPVEGKPFRLLCSVCCGPWDEKRGWRELGDFQAAVRIMTIGQVRVQRGGGDDRTEYMCLETGVGSGSIWKEDDLLPSRDLAETRAQQLVEETVKRRLEEEESDRQRKIKKRARKARSAATS